MVVLLSKDYANSCTNTYFSIIKKYIKFTRRFTWQQLSQQPAANGTNTNKGNKVQRLLERNQRMGGYQLLGAFAMNHQVGHALTGKVN